MDRFHRPVRMPIEAFDSYIGAPDPAVSNRIAHDTAYAVLHQVHDSNDPELVERVVSYANTNGLDDLLQLWSNASAHTIPGCLWRLYLIHTAVGQNSSISSYLFRRGIEVDVSISPVVAGATQPTGPKEISLLAQQILRGAFTGDFADALDRAAAFCAVISQGAAAVAESDETTDPDRASVLLRSGARYLDYANDFSASARLWRAGRLD